MKKVYLTALLLACALTPVAQRTTRGSLTASGTPLSPAAGAQTDTIVDPAPHTVDINGYDKPLRSRRESFFVTNNGSAAVEALAITLKYYDSANRLLHSVSRRVALDVPAGETRQVNISSWDYQLSFYYRNSAVPQRVETATPYDVTIDIDTLFVRR